MTKEAHQNTPKERLDRYLVLVKRARKYARSTIAIAFVFLLLALVLALTTRRVYRSETTVVYRDAVRTGRDVESPTQRAARLGPRLKEYVYLRSRLQASIERFDLYPVLVRRSMLDAVDEMQKNVSFRTRSPDTFVIAFLHEDPHIAQEVTAHLAETMISDYTSDNLDSALTTHDVLRTEVEAAQKHVEETSRSLARFLAQHPQFTWGLGDSPYASGQQVGSNPTPSRTSKDKPILDPVLADLVARLHTIDAELAGADASNIPAPTLPNDAQKQRDAAAAALGTAEADLEQKLRKYTPAHPDAKIARSHVDRARKALASAEANLTQAIAGMVPPPQANSGLDPARRTELEAERKTVIAQIAARRAGGKRPEPVVANTPAPRSETPDVVELETEWHKLRLDLERARDAFRKAEDKERTARLQANSAEREVQELLVVSDPAYLPVHPESGRGRVFLAGAVVALFLALGYAGARVLLCDTIFDEGDALALEAPPFLVTVPHIPHGAKSLGPVTIRPPIREKPKEKETPLVRRDEPSHETNEMVSEDELMELGDEVADTPRAGSLALPISLPSNALHTYVEKTMSNLVVVGVPYTASTGALEDVTRNAPTSVVGALRVLRHRLEQRRNEEPLVVSIQSAIPGEGKTTITTRLAQTLAEADRARVVIVEGNLSRPKLASTLGLRLPDDLSLTMQIRRRMGGQTGAWSIVRIGVSVYALVESSEPCVFPAALHSSWFPAIIRELKTAYDYVVIDGCAVLDAGDANVLEEVSDVVVLVARAGMTTGAMVANCVRQLGDRRLFGLVLNDEPPRHV
jgi:Mrp family chromosome partitioning ATPase